MDHMSFYYFPALLVLAGSGQHWPVLEALGNFGNAGKTKFENTGFADGVKEQVDEGTKRVDKVGQIDEVRRGVLKLKWQISKQG